MAGGGEECKCEENSVKRMRTSHCLQCKDNRPNILKSSDNSDRSNKYPLSQLVSTDPCSDLFSVTHNNSGDYKTVSFEMNQSRTPKENSVAVRKNINSKPKRTVQIADRVPIFHYETDHNNSSNGLLEVIETAKALHFKNNNSPEPSCLPPSAISSAPCPQDVEAALAQEIPTSPKKSCQGAGLGIENMPADNIEISSASTRFTMSKDFNHTTQYHKSFFKANYSMTSSALLTNKESRSGDDSNRGDKFLEQSASSCIITTNETRCGVCIPGSPCVLPHGASVGKSSPQNVSTFGHASNISDLSASEGTRHASNFHTPGILPVPASPAGIKPSSHLPPASAHHPPASPHAKYPDPQVLMMVYGNAAECEKVGGCGPRWVPRSQVPLPNAASQKYM